MALNFDVVGHERPLVHRSWTSTEAILYALGVGAGNPDPFAELQYTTELFEQQVLPTFASLLVPQRLSPELGDYDPKMVVHAQESLTFFKPLPVNGSVQISSRVAGMFDKGSGVLTLVEADIADAGTGDLLARAVSGLFFRGYGGIGGERGPKDPDWALPEREPTASVSYDTRPEQALLYRLNGDRNPLHADPAFATAAGFDRPILHGLATFGMAGRAVLQALTGGDGRRLTSISARMSSPVTPGDTIVTDVWDDGDGEGLFRVTKTDGTVVATRGRATYRAA